MRRPGECRARIGKRPVAVEEEGLDSGVRQRVDTFARARGAGDAPAVRKQAAGKHARAIAEAEAEEALPAHAKARGLRNRGPRNGEAAALRGYGRRGAGGSSAST